MMLLTFYLQLNKNKFVQIFGLFCLILWITLRTVDELNMFL